MGGPSYAVFVRVGCKVLIPYPAACDDSYSTLLRYTALNVPF